MDTFAAPAEWFADTLAPPAADPLAPPPMPPVSRGRRFVDVLANIAGAGVDRAGSYQAGLNSGAQYRLHTAQTESALAQAEERRQNAMGQSMLNDAKAKAYADPNFVPDMPFYAMLATGANDMANAQLGQQRYGLREQMLDPNLAPEQRYRVGEALQERVLPRIETAGGQNYNLATDPNMQAPTMTPLQQAQVESERALTGQRNRSPAAGAGSGPVDEFGIGPGGMSYHGRNAPAGQQFYHNEETGEVRLRPLADATAGSMERRFLARVENAARNASDDLQALSHMPLAASSGVFGVGAGPQNQGILAATKDSLRNELNDSDVQIYNVIVEGLGNAMQALEGFGMRGSEGMAQRFQNQVAIRAGDKELTRLSRLAAARQSVENATDTILSQGVASPETQAALVKLKQDLARAIPFTPMDIVQLNASGGRETLQDLIARRVQPAAASAPGAAPQATPAAGGEAMRGTSKSGKPIISRDGGKTWEYE